MADGLAIGLLGGSFNPAHEGHRYISLVAMKRLGLDYVWWLVSPQNPLKAAAGMAPREERLGLARTIANHPRIVVSDLEAALGTRYTIDTVIALKRRFPQVRFVWLMGSDNLDGFHRWKRWQDIARAVPIAVVQRPGSVMAAAHAPLVQRFPGRLYPPDRHFADRRPPAIAMIDGRRNPLSATAIRMAAAHDPVVSATRPS
jgi:nicotinate-nucleotide adenylyltransferase